MDCRACLVMPCKAVMHIHHMAFPNAIESECNTQDQKGEDNDNYDVPEPRDCQLRCQLPRLARCARREEQPSGRHSCARRSTAWCSTGHRVGQTPPAVGRQVQPPSDTRATERNVIEKHRHHQPYKHKTMIDYFVAMSKAWIDAAHHEGGSRGRGRGRRGEWQVLGEGRREQEVAKVIGECP